MDQGRKASLLGALMLIAAASLPWISTTALFGNVEGVDGGIARGWEGDGFITGRFGLIIVVGVLLSERILGRGLPALIIILGLLACGVVISDVLRIMEIAPEAGFVASTGSGLYLTLAGAAVTLIGGFFNLVRPARNRT